MKKSGNVLELKMKRKEVKTSFPKSYSELEKSNLDLTIKTLLSALRLKDDYTWGHSLRVAFFCVAVGKEMNLSSEELFELELSALFHDIGKIGVPDSVLLKPSRLTEEEFQEMKLHPSKSASLLEEIPNFKKISMGAKHHHERFDGRGYPSGLKGEDIPLFARIILIADTFDAMTSTRPYRKGLAYEVAFEELIEFSGTQFDSNLVKHFISAIKKEDVKKSTTFTLTLVQGEFEKEAA